MHACLSWYLSRAGGRWKDSRSRTFGGQWSSGGNTEPRPASLERAELGRPEDRGSERLAGLDCLEPSWQAGVSGSGPGGGVKGAGHCPGRDEDVWKEQKEAGRSRGQAAVQARPQAQPFPPTPWGLWTWGLSLDVGALEGCGSVRWLWGKAMLEGPRRCQPRASASSVAARRWMSRCERSGSTSGRLPPQGHRRSWASPPGTWGPGGGLEQSETVSPPCKDHSGWSLEWSPETRVSRSLSRTQGPAGRQQGPGVRRRPPAHRGTVPGGGERGRFWRSLERICLWCRRRRFDPWGGKIPWRRMWQPTPVFLPGETHAQNSLVGYSPWGCRVRHNWATEHPLDAEASWPSPHAG